MEDVLQPQFRSLVMNNTRIVLRVFYLSDITTSDKQYLGRMVCIPAWRNSKTQSH